MIWTSAFGKHNICKWIYCFFSLIGGCMNGCKGWKATTSFPPGKLTLISWTGLQVEVTPTAVIQAPTPQFVEGGKNTFSPISLFPSATFGLMWQTLCWWPFHLRATLSEATCVCVFGAVSMELLLLILNSRALVFLLLLFFCFVFWGICGLSVMPVCFTGTVALRCVSLKSF